MSVPRVSVSHDAEQDWLSVIEFGRVDDGQAGEKWSAVSEDFGFLREAPGGAIVGFTVLRFAAFDVDAPEVAEIWERPHFNVPLLGLACATPGEIILGARPLLGQDSTINRVYFHAAIEAHDDPEMALALWLRCLEAGDSLAHYGVGYTLYELGRYREAYRHLRHYAEVAPEGPWTWYWLGKAATAIGELDEAREAFEVAVALDEDEETGAAQLLIRVSSPQPPSQS